MTPPNPESASGDAAALLATAWESYDQGRLDQALARARQARDLEPTRPGSAVALGWFLLESGDSDGAYVTLHRALVLDPEHAAAHWYLGTLLYRGGRLQEAEPVLREALRLDPNLDEARITLARLLHDRGRLDEALQQCCQALSKGERSHRLELLGWLLAKTGEEEAAVGVLRKALARSPGGISLRYRLATVLSRCGRDAEAAAVLQQGLAIAPDHPELLLRLGWLQRSRGEAGAARDIGHGLTDNHPDLSGGWRLLAAVLEDGGDLEQAETCLARAQRLDPDDQALVITRAALCRRLGRLDDAAGLLGRLLEADPGVSEARFALARLEVERGHLDQARRLLHQSIRGGACRADGWRLLAVVLHGMGRPHTAIHAIARARRLAPESPETQRLAAHLALECEDLELAGEANGVWRRLSPDDPAALAQAAVIALGSGDPEAAARCAEQGIVRSAGSAECWWRLGQARRRQGRLEEAESCLHRALELEPARWEFLRALGGVLLDGDRLDEAECCLHAACREVPGGARCRLDLARVQRLAGRFSAALEQAGVALELRPGWAEARCLWAACRREQGHGESERAPYESEATARLAVLLRDSPHDRGAAMELLRLAAGGNPAARDSLRLIPRHRRLVRVRELLEWAVHHLGADECGQLAELGRALFPDDPFIGCAALYIAVAGEIHPPPGLRRQLRDWAGRLALTEGLATPCCLPADPRQRPLRVAYLASHLHGSLLLGVIAAHDRGRVRPFLYTAPDQVDAARAGLRGAAVVQPLEPEGAAESLRAAGMDVVVDTVGVHPFKGQLDVLRLLRRRAAPVQCGWLGTWGGGGGLYDALVVDEQTLPAVAEPGYEERIIRLPGGQWSWTPPLHVQDPGPVPCLSRGHVTFGSTVRGFRLSRRTLGAWARLLARVPGSRLELLGRCSRDWRLRAEFTRILALQGVDPERVGFRYRRPYAEHLGFFRHIDIHLDAFPGNGGLGSLDALWMGVPVVTCAGGEPEDCLVGERQGSSLLHAIGHSEWVAGSAREYLRIAADLAADTETLVHCRAHLRQRLLTSPLVDPRRVAAALEEAWEALRGEAREVAVAGDTRTLARALADRSLRTWLDRHPALVLPRAEGPEVSVVMVLYNQAGLTLQALTALAAQRGVTFETLIVDNGSGDETPRLLRRLTGGRILRNGENRGFLRAANQGAEIATGRHILFLNNDVVLQPGALRAAVERIDSAPDIGAVGGRIVLPDGTLQEAGCSLFADGSARGYGRGEDPAAPEFLCVREVDFCSGAFLLVRADLWRRLGGFDPLYAPAYFEDADLCLRAWEAGFRVVYEPAALMRHVEGGSAAAGEPEARMRANRERFRQRHAPRLAGRSAPELSNPLLYRWAARPWPRILIIDHAVPHVTAGSGFGRARQIIRALRRHHVTLFPLADGESDWDATYRSLPDTVEVILGLGEEALEGFLERRAGVYQVLLVCRPTSMVRVAGLYRERPALFRGMSIVYDSEALFALRDIAAAAVRGRPLSRPAQLRRVRREMEQARCAERVLAVSRRDADLFAMAGFGDVRILSHAHPLRSDGPGPEGRSGLLFVGALNPDSPNEDGLSWFVSEVLPRIRARLAGEVELTIVGECRSNRIAALEAPGVRLLGRVEELRPLYDAARLFVAPVRYAGGVPVKVIEAACNGLPVVASAVLARQLGWSSGTELVAARSAEVFAMAVVRLLRDDALWLRLRRGMLRRAAREHDPEPFARAVQAAVETK